MAALVEDLSRIEERLLELWRDEAQANGGTTRACKMNFVLIAETGAQAAAEASRLLATVSSAEPGRAILVAPSGDAGSPPVRAHVSPLCHRGADGRRVCSEQITLEVREDALELVPSTVLQLLVEEMPTCTFWRRRTLDPRKVLDALCKISDRLVVDGTLLSSPLDELAGLLLRPRPRVDDLSWARLEPWREAVASLFDMPALRGSLTGITRLRVVAGGRVPAAYLAGWLASRLGWRELHSGWQRPDGKRVAIDLALDGQEATGQTRAVEIDLGEEPVRTSLVIERMPESPDVVRLQVDRAESCPSPYCLKLPLRDDGAVIAGLLQREEDDPIYRSALGPATRFCQR